MDKSAIQGDYTDIRFIKGRKVCAITIEIPIEAGAAFVAAFGTPNPATGVPVAMARLDPNAKPELKGGKLCQRAAILCGEGAFARFLINEKHAYFNGVTYPTEGSVADFLRDYCFIESRRELDHNEDAARKFLDLVASYEAWKLV